MKNLKKLGKALTKAEQKTVNGGYAPFCTTGMEACYNPSTCRWSCVPNGTCC